MRQSFIREIREASDEELLAKLDKAKFNLYDMKVKARTGQMEKTADIRKQKKDIARILTEVNLRKTGKKIEADAAS